MKKVIILSLGIAVLILVASIVRAIPNPAPVYCTEIGYTLDGDYCDFGDGNRCELWAFYRGECGSQYIKVLPCVQSGGSLKPGHECCQGLTSINAASFFNSSTRICITAVGSWPICAPCGNGLCDEPLENKCNCRQDCTQEPVCGNGICEEGEASYRECTCSPSGQGDCECDIYPYGECYCAPPEPDCSSSCVVKPGTCPQDCTLGCAGVGQEGDIHGAEWGQPTTCCSGLKAVALSNVPYNGACPEIIPAYGTQFLCINCGDGICGLAENKCNCPQDCGQIQKQKSVCGNRICEEGEDEIIVIGMSYAIPPSYIYGPRCAQDCSDSTERTECNSSEECRDKFKSCYYQCSKNICIPFNTFVPLSNYPECESQQVHPVSSCSLMFIPAGCSCEEGVVSCPSVIRKDENEIPISIEGVENSNKITIRAQNSEVETSEKMIIQNEKLYMELDNGEKEEVVVLPEEASSKAAEATEKSQVEKIELRQEQKRPVYSIMAIKRIRLFWLIPVSMKIETKIDAGNGNVLSVKKPWWSFLAW